MDHKTKLYIIVGIIIFVLAVGGILGYIYRDKLRDLLGRAQKAEENIPGLIKSGTNSNKAKTLSDTKIIEWTNYYRAQEGLKPLSQNATLTRAAKAKTEDMFQNQYFDHISPSGVSPSQVVKSQGYDYKVTGENLALGDFTDEKDLVDAWMNSPGHRANTLNPDYTEIGVHSGLGNLEDRSKTWMSVQEFGAPAPNCTEPDANTLTEINSKKAQYDSIVAQINTLKAQIEVLRADGTRNDELNAKIDEYNALIQQSETLRAQIESLTNQYNAAVNTYNNCQKQ